MPTLRFENTDLPEASRVYSVEVPEGQSTDAVVKSLADSGWRLAVDGGNEDTSGSAPVDISEAQSAPTTPEGI